MKRIFVLLLVLCLMLGCLTGCKKNKNDNQISTPSSDNTTEESSENTSEESNDNTTEEENVYPYSHPLTGEPLKEPWSGQIVAVMVNNIKQAMPQHGVSEADIVFEMEEEGSVTRNMALFSNISEVGPIGSIRSTRTYFVSLAEAFDAYLVTSSTDFG